MIGWLYTQALPANIRKAMKAVSGSDCYRVKRNITAIRQRPNDQPSHQIVQDMVKERGGERVSGWLLSKDKHAIKQGLYVWIFHSIWKTPEGGYEDIAGHDSYNNDKEAIFWLDPERRADLSEGTAYNLIVTLENFKTVAYLSETAYKQLTPATPYWAEKKLRFFKTLQEHSGIYRMIDAHHPHNLKQLEEQYDCKVVNEHIVPNVATNKISTQMFFDFSIG